MAKLNIEQIRNLAVELIKETPQGIRYTELRNKILQRFPDTPSNTINGSIWDLEIKRPEAVSKPSRGLYVPLETMVDTSEALIEPTASKSSDTTESQYYLPFADWLRNDLADATVAKSLGGAGLGDKWGTPDVVGTYKPLAKDRIKFPIEIISAEIKTNASQAIVAFGQAIAYRLFSSKCYVVMPRAINPLDKDRLESLCLLFGLGFVVFDLDVANPKFEILVRAQRSQPDMFYVNKFADDLFKHDHEVFQELFG
jgi:hypothetical protein